MATPNKRSSAAFFLTLAIPLLAITLILTSTRAANNHLTRQKLSRDGFLQSLRDLRRGASAHRRARCRPSNGYAKQAIKRSLFLDPSDTAAGYYVDPYFDASSARRTWHRCVCDGIGEQPASCSCCFDRDYSHRVAA